MRSSILAVTVLLAAGCPCPVPMPGAGTRSILSIRSDPRFGWDDQLCRSCARLLDKLQDVGASKCVDY